MFIRIDRGATRGMLFLKTTMETSANDSDSYYASVIVTYSLIYRRRLVSVASLVIE